MAITLDGTNGVVVSGNTNTLSGVTVSKGGGNVATNTAVGASALAANTTGTRAVAVGYEALKLNTTGDRNHAFGLGALGSNTTGDFNSALGYSALNANTSGANNVAIGYTALVSNTTASNNTAVGYQAGYTTAAGNGANTFLGYQAGYTFNSSVDGNNTLIGERAGYSLTTGYQNTFLGSVAGYNVTTGYRNTILGRYNGNQGGLDIRTQSNYIVLSDGDGNPRGYFDNNGTFFVASTIGVIYSIGVYNTTTASAANINVNSSGAFSRSTSALKYKQDIRDLESMDIGLLRPVRYKSKCEGDDQTKDHLGLIADEAAEAGFEELVTRGETGEIEGFQYERLTVVLLKKLQTLDAEFKAYVATHP